MLLVVRFHAGNIIQNDSEDAPEKSLKQDLCEERCRIEAQQETNGRPYTLGV